MPDIAVEFLHQLPNSYGWHVNFKWLFLSLALMSTHNFRRKFEVKFTIAMWFEGKTAHSAISSPTSCFLVGWGVTTSTFCTFFMTSSFKKVSICIFVLCLVVSWTPVCEICEQRFVSDQSSFRVKWTQINWRPNKKSVSLRMNVIPQEGLFFQVQGVCLYFSAYFRPSQKKYLTAECSF